jgi:hypothetical protein
VGFVLKKVKIPNAELPASADSVTGPAKPFMPLTVIATEVLLPLAIDKLLGLAVKVKPGAGAPVSVTVMKLALATELPGEMDTVEFKGDTVKSGAELPASLLPLPPSGNWILSSSDCFSEFV